MGVGSGVSCPSLTLGLGAAPSITLARTLASFTAPASVSNLHPAMWAGEGLALLTVALHAAPLRTEATALGTFGRP